MNDKIRIAIFLLLILWAVCCGVMCAWLQGRLISQEVQRQMKATKLKQCQCGCNLTECSCPRDEVFGQTYDENCPELNK